MAIEFNIDAAKKWFLGEDKIISFQIFGNDNITPIDVSTWAMEWVLRKKDKDKDPALILKTTAADQIVVAGDFGAGEQRVTIAFSSDDTSTNAKIKAGTYRYSLKRTDVGNEGVLAYGSVTFLQSTAH